MRNGIITGMILSIIILLWALLSGAGVLFEAIANDAAAAELARGQAQVMVIQAQSQADTLQAYTEVSVRAIESDRRVAHGLDGWQVAAVALLVAAVLATVAALWLRIKALEAQVAATAAQPEATEEAQ